MSDKDSDTKARRSFSPWGVIGVFLVVIIIAGAALIGVREGRGKGVEITLVTENSTSGRIYVGGAVNNPGIYPLREGDNIPDLISAAGGLRGDGGTLEIIAVAADKTDSPQRVDINRAEAWLLAALPGIGEGKAQAIVQYRQKNGVFRDTYELLKVPGIGDTIFAGIKDFITVGE